MNSKKIHAIILARGGSKGLKNKNLFLINKKPLVYWSIKSCIKSKNISQTWVSSDNKKILNISKKYGAKTIYRPKKFSSDTASSEIAWLHAVKEIKKKQKIDYVIGLQPTSAIRDFTDIDKAIKKFFKNKYDSLFSAKERDEAFSWNLKKLKVVPNYNIFKRQRRQNLKRRITENGSFYIFKSEKFLKKRNRLFGKIGFHMMKNFKGFEIDTLEDAILVDLILKNKRIFNKI